jgi:glycerol-3-phosphate dehydrogenase
MAVYSGGPDLSAIDGRSFDVAVIGSGINGSSTAAALMEARYDVLLVDKNDFGSGSSSRSSRMLHCGLNYLALAREARTLADKLWNVSLARKMMQQRATLFDRLRGRLTPRTLHIPLQAEDPVRPWQYDAAFTLLKSLGGYSLPLDYRRAKKSKLQAHPLARYLSGNVVGIASFSELVFDWPERVCVDYAMRAAEGGATVFNYVALRSAKKLDNAWELALVDNVSGQFQCTVRARAVVNMAGVWSDKVNSLASPSTSTVTANKGCHIAVKLPAAFAGQGIVCRNAIGHMFICMPWKGLHIIGPTETAVDGIAEPPKAGESDVEALLREADRVMPGASIRRQDVLFQWAGYRPATFDPNNGLGSWKRKIYCKDASDDTAWVSMSWGRLADHALTAEDIVGKVKASLCNPASRPLPHGPSAIATIKHREPDLDQIIAREVPKSVADVMFGRTGWGWDADLGQSRVADVADALARVAGDKEAGQYIAEYNEFLLATFGAEPSNQRSKAHGALRARR